MVFYIGAQGGLKTLAKWPKDPGVFSIYRSIDRGYLHLPGFRIGTVDKFQGQEAPISIYSMATSSLDDAPHGMEFLYSLNRLNVATSRARCLALVVASPELLRVRCRTPRQMRLANAIARLVEVAKQGA